MTRTLPLCLAALLAAAPAWAQSVTVTESGLNTRALSPTLGATESLPVIDPAIADSLIQVPVTNALPGSGEVSPTLGGTESLPLINPAIAAAATRVPTISSASQPGALDGLPRISAEEIATIVIDAPLSVDPSAPSAQQDLSLFVIEDGTILPADVWSARDSESCTASGGVQLELPGNRIGCFQL